MSEQAPSESAEKPPIVFTPQAVYEAWRDANLIYPQVGYGIAAALGAELFGGGHDLSRANVMMPSENQLQEITSTMRAAHGARGINTFPSEEEARELILRLWTRIRNYVLSVAATYTVAATGKPFTETFVMSTEHLIALYARTISEGIQSHPHLREELASVFKIIMEALEQEEMKALEKERRSLIDQIKHGRPFRGVPKTDEQAERQAKGKRVRLLADTGRMKIFEYIIKHSKEHGLSVQFHDQEAVRKIYYSLAT